MGVRKSNRHATGKNRPARLLKRKAHKNHGSSPAVAGANDKKKFS